eukprot:Skav206941  [mRNA]  locus=scaffold2457:76618:83644:- [translate_table: standard]
MVITPGLAVSEQASWALGLVALPPPRRAAENPPFLGQKVIACRRYIAASFPSEAFVAPELPRQVSIPGGPGLEGQRSSNQTGHGRLYQCGLVTLAMGVCGAAGRDAKRSRGRTTTRFHDWNWLNMVKKKIDWATAVAVKERSRTAVDGTPERSLEDFVPKIAALQQKAPTAAAAEKEQQFGSTFHKRVKNLQKKDLKKLVAEESGTRVILLGSKTAGWLTVS